jgi:periplasmic divalent cation tolerance protein
MTSELIGFVTCPQGKGQELAHKVVEEKLVACVNIISAIRSVYMWKGKIEDDSEELLVVKTHAEKWKEFESRMKEIHPYEVPEIICFRIEDGYAPYLDWLKSNVLS